MSRPVVAALLAVFAVHLLLFAGLAWRRRDRYYLMVAGTFALLVLAFALRLWAPELSAGSIALHLYPRAGAWVLAVLSLRSYLRRRRAAAQTPR